MSGGAPFTTAGRRRSIGPTATRSSCHRGGRSRPRRATTHGAARAHALDRPPVPLQSPAGQRFGDDAYAAEELIAEMGAAFLCAHCRIDGELRHAGYLSSWLRVLRADKRAIFVAAAKAQQAADYLLARPARRRTRRWPPEPPDTVPTERPRLTPVAVLHFPTERRSHDPGPNHPARAEDPRRAHAQRLRTVVARRGARLPAAAAARPRRTRCSSAYSSTPSTG